MPTAVRSAGRVVSRVLDCFVATGFVGGVASLFHSSGAPLLGVFDLLSWNATPLGLGVLSGVVGAMESECAVLLVIRPTCGRKLAVAVLCLFSLVLAAMGSCLPRGWARTCSCLSLVSDTSVRGGLLRNIALMSGISMSMVLGRRGGFRKVWPIRSGTSGNGAER